MKKFAVIKRIQALALASALALGAFVIPQTLRAATEAVSESQTTEIKITGNSTMGIGEAQKLEANVDVTWKSGNTAVATVDAKGCVKGIANGTATITATAKDGSGAKATFIVTVGSVVVTDIDIKEETVSMVQGGASQQLYAVVLPDNATNKGVRWLSSDPAVAKVDDYGTVTPLKPGKVKISAIAKDSTTARPVRAESSEITVQPKKLNVKRLSRVKDRQVTATWAKVAGATGYQVQYTKSSAFLSGIKTKTVKKGTTLSLTIDTKKKGKWYFRVRAYKTVNGKKILGDWGKVKSIKVP